MPTPWYHHAITLTSHTPFTFYRDIPIPRAVEDRIEILSANIQDKRLRNYLCSMAYVDHCLEILIENAVAIPNTVILIYGDHCPEIHDGATGRFALQGEKVEIVPFIILGASLRDPPTLVTHTDLNGLIADLAGASIQTRSMITSPGTGSFSDPIWIKNQLIDRSVILSALEDLVPLAP